MTKFSTVRWLAIIKERLLVAAFHIMYLMLAKKCLLALDTKKSLLIYFILIVINQKYIFIIYFKYTIINTYLSNQAERQIVLAMKLEIFY